MGENMARKKRDCAKIQLAATNPFSVYRKGYVLRWSMLFAALICVVLAVGLYFLNRPIRP